MDRKYRFAERELLYYNSAEKQFIHLFDGGVSDNLGLRGPISSITQLSEREIDPKEIGLSNTKRVAVIIVNAQTKMSKDKKILDVIPTYIFHWVVFTFINVRRIITHDIFPLQLGDFILTDQE